MALAVLGLGSNRGDSLRILESAIRSLEEMLREPRRASLYRSDPLYITDQPPFLNTALAGFCDGEPAALLEAVHRIEAAHGRDRRHERRWGERTLDIDILLFGEQALCLPSPRRGEAPLLEIPHPRLKERRFALEPLLELLPEARDPVTGERLASVLAALPPQGIYLFPDGNHGRQFFGSCGTSGPPGQYP
ncbi:MAG: 2-amino-4-hydroxy-6-hydroxymethyldihydropteridine diphosphokinase [Treponema sp.]|nr:2-amino-4-hydroxy-6-hydroxymethyldihydropteridine diphosphokinase [Treponema sp.]